MSTVEIKYTERATLGPPKTYTRTATVKMPLREMIEITKENLEAGSLDTCAIHIDTLLAKAERFVKDAGTP